MKRPEVKMADVKKKRITKRTAVAKGKVKVKTKTIKAIQQGTLAKGDVLSVAKLAGIMAAKKTPELIPLCHPLRLDYVDVECKLDEKGSFVEIISTVKAEEKTGVEMEALAATAATALTIYDMCKSVDKAMIIDEIRLVKKAGGRSGTYIRK